MPNSRYNRTKNKTTDLIQLNYQQNVINAKIDPDTIDNLVPESALKEFQNGDENPYYKVQKIEYPIVANGITYLESFFESYISKLNERPIPGSKSGHEPYWGVRPNTDFIMVGGKIESKKNGKGYAYFKNYIPKNGAESSNETFIKEAKSDMVHFSLVTRPEYHITEDKDGNEVVNAISSLGAERNDAVEWGEGAMQQQTNAKENDDLENQDYQNNKYKGGTVDVNDTKKEVLKTLKTLKANADITLSEIAEAIGLQNQIVTDEHIQALKIVNSLKELGMKDPVKDYEKLQKRIEADRDAVRNARLDEVYGSEKDKDTGKANLLRAYAAGKTENKFGDELEAEIVKLKKDPIALDYAARRTDVNSDENNIGIVENANTETEPERRGGIKVETL